MKDVLIVGAGLVGSLLAANLSQKGYRVKVYERRPDMRKQSMSAGKSINLALSERGWKAIDMVGLRERVQSVAIPMYGRKIHDIKGEVTFQAYGLEGQAIYSVSRGELNAVLMDRAEKDLDVQIHFGWKCISVDFERSVAHFEHSETGEQREEVADLIFGTDGAFSQVRADMQKTPRFNYQQEFIPHGYRELLLPPSDTGEYRLEKNALHIWPRGGYMLIALPNLDKSFTCTLFMPYEGEPSFSSIENGEGVDAFFKRVFPDFHAIMPGLEADYHAHPLSDLVIIRCYPWVRHRTCILGDASHAIVPFYGQGMNSGFEDCSVLNTLIDAHDNQWDGILDEFQKTRKPDADAIAELAMRNYIEMRDLVGDERFLLQKKIEARIHERHPDKWMPLYSQVTFSHRRYSEALREGQEQDKIMDEIMDMPDIAQRWDSLEIETKILSAKNR